MPGVSLWRTPGTNKPSEATLRGRRLAAGEVQRRARRAQGAAGLLAGERLAIESQVVGHVGGPVLALVVALPDLPGMDDATAVERVVQQLDAAQPGVGIARVQPEVDLAGPFPSA